MVRPEILKRVLSRVHGVADQVHDVIQPLHRHAKGTTPLLRNQLQRCRRASEAQPGHQRRDNTCMRRNHAIN
jgi:hypothetical protein